MKIRDVNYPEEIISAILDNNLVIFAGAGVSMASPTNLPSFEKLTKEMSKSAGISISDSEAFEECLGRVNDSVSNLKEDVCKKLSGPYLSPNDYHKILLEVFDDKEVRIVTTNYDLMFEQHINNKREIDVFSYPALPYGNNINGIVHLHGCASKHENIILTDSDFGEAYMYYGNATNFLKQLFISDYTILFVGYSYSDIVLKYFTRSLPILSNNKRFIFADHSQAEKFESLGLTPIIYEKGNYDQLYMSLSDLSKLVNRREDKWQLRIRELAEDNPKSLSPEFNYEINRILSNIHYHNKFFSIIRGKKWAEYLFDNGYFNDVFSKRQPDDFVLKKIEWLIDNIIFDEWELFIDFCYNKDFTFSQILENEIIHKVCKICDEHIDIDFRKVKSLINLVDFKNIYPHNIDRLISVCYTHSPKLDLEASRVIADVIGFEIKRNSIIGNNSMEVKLRLGKDTTLLLWEKYKKSGSKHNIVILDSISKEVFELNKYHDVGVYIEKFNFNSFYAEHQEYLSDIDVFIKIFSELLEGIDENNKEYWLKKHLNSNVSILIRSALFVLKSMNSYSDKEKLEILKENNFKKLDSELREELFMLYSDIFPGLDDLGKKEFLKEAMSEKIDNDMYGDELYCYQKYNLLIWLSRFDRNNYDIKKYIGSIKDKYPYFKPRTDPQKSIIRIKSGWADAPLPFSGHEIISDLDKIYGELLTYSGDGFKEAERRVLISTIQNICNENTSFRTKLIKKLISDKNYENDLWIGIIESVIDLDLGDEQLIEIYTEIFIDQVIKNHHKVIASNIYTFIKNRETVTSNLLNFFFEKIMYLWKYASNCDEELGGYMNKAINSSKGLIALSLIKIINFSVNNSGIKVLEDKYKKFLEKMINEEEFNDSLVVILGNASFLFSLDRSWCINHILNKYNPEKQKLFNIAWEGFVYQSFLTLDLYLEIKPIFHKTMKKLTLINNHKLKEDITILYTRSMLEFSDKPNEEFIPNIFCADNSIEIIRKFYIEINKYLQSLDMNSKEDMFDKWILEFLTNRVKNKKITNDEKKLILKLMIKLSSKNKELSSILDLLNEGFDADFNLINYFNNIEAVSENSDLLCSIMTTITNQIKKDDKKSPDIYTEKLLLEIYQRLRKFDCKIEKLEENLKIINVLK